MQTQQQQQHSQQQQAAATAKLAAQLAQSQPPASSTNQMNSTLAGQLAPSPGAGQMNTQAGASIQQQVQLGASAQSPQPGQQLNQLAPPAAADAGKGGKNGPTTPGQDGMTSRGSKPLLGDVRQEFGKPAAGTEENGNSMDSNEIGGKCIKTEIKDEKDEIKEEPMDQASAGKPEQKPEIKTEAQTPGGMNDSVSGDIKSEPGSSKPGTPAAASISSEPLPPRQKKGSFLRIFLTSRLTFTRLSFAVVIFFTSKYADFLVFVKLTPF